MRRSPDCRSFSQARSHLAKRWFAGAFTVCLCIVLFGTELSAMGNGGRKQQGQEGVSVPSTPARGGRATIRDIVSDPDKFRSVEVVLQGVFRGWKAACPASFMMTRSDWIIEDESGCLYVTGIMPEGMAPAQPHAEHIQVTGRVIEDKNGKVVLKASQVNQLTEH